MGPATPPRNDAVRRRTPSAYTADVVSPAERSSPEQGRGNNFDVLRVALAGLVLFSHSFPLAAGTNDTEPFFRLSSGQVTGGELAVDFFFVISGYLITRSWLSSRSTDDYLRKRIRRIYPGYLVCLVVSVLITAACAAARAREYASGVILYQNDTLLEGVLLLKYSLLDNAAAFPANPWPRASNGSLWTLQPELYCYLLVAGLGVVGALRRRFMTLFWVALFAGYSLQVLHTGNLQNSFWRLVLYFGAGALFFLHADRVRFGHGPLVALAALAVAASVVVPPVLLLVLPVAGSYLLLSFAFSTRIRWHGFASRGDVSYGLYLYAFIVQQAIVYALGIRSPLLLFATALPVTCLCAWLSWRYVERPFLVRR
jgi:peptidoglycan/LPS O-acetylase OafA/YrhL